MDCKATPTSMHTSHSLKGQGALLLAPGLERQQHQPSRKFRIVGNALIAIIVCTLFYWIPQPLTVGRQHYRSLILGYNSGSTPNGSNPLEVIQLSPPVRFKYFNRTEAEPVGSQVLISHSFGNSYGQPAVVTYTPPSYLFDRVTWNLTVTSKGRQFDRLGTVSLGDVEILRTSTAEPTVNGIVWTHIKDVTSFLTLFKSPQTLVFDLGNLVNDIYTGSFNVTLTASYYYLEGHEHPPADAIFAISRGAVNASSAFSVPPDDASRLITLPRNAVRAVATIAATGQALEEFWWSNVLQQDVERFPSAGELPGFSPYREVQLFIDGELAGVVWPFPIIFTGGVVPGLWRPVVGIDAFDLREEEIDITPWLPVLSDGRSHNFSIAVSGLSEPKNGKTVLSEEVGFHWVVTGKIFVWIDEDSDQTTGSAPLISSLSPSINTTTQLTLDPETNNSVLSYEVQVRRMINITSTIKTSEGSQNWNWIQDLTFGATGVYSDRGNRQRNTVFFEERVHDLRDGYRRRVFNELSVDSLLTETNDTLSIAANVARTKQHLAMHPTVFPLGTEAFHPVGTFGAGERIRERGSAVYHSNTTTKKALSFGNTTQVLEFLVFLPTNDNWNLEYAYGRSVDARNGSLVRDAVDDRGKKKTSFRDVDMSGPALEYAQRPADRLGRWLR